ncbi:MAG: TRAP transporter substrate-binding protein DctP [Thermodesulfobacteriota bacterium]|nr:TRAP transporter substrate-binding protein DctP [Thermodesulfobacteriota bacterium]
MACPDMAVFELPFLFNDFDEVEYVREKIRSKLDNSYEKNGFKNLILIDQDFDIPWSVRWPIRGPEDFKKSRFIAWCPPVEDDLLESLGASPIPVNVPEVPSNVRAKVVDAFLAPPIYLVGTQLYTVVKYVTPCKIRYSPGGIVISMKAWNRIPQKYHKTIQNILPEHEKEINDFRHDSNKKCLKAMIKYGVNEVKLTPEEINLLKKRTRPVWDKLAGQDYSRELLDQILFFLEDYRSRNVAR